MTAEIIIRRDEGDDPEKTVKPWATVWDTILGGGDWALADTDIEPGNIGGFAVGDELGSCIVHCLFTDLRRADWMEGTEVGGGPRGWPGDYFDLDTAAGERPMGSYLWTLERSAINDDTAGLVKTYALQALQTLVDQGRVAEFDVEVEIDKAKGRVDFSVQGFALSGKTVFQNQFPFIG